MSSLSKYERPTNNKPKANNVKYILLGLLPVLIILSASLLLTYIHTL